eukprot:scaffold147593_cov21-Tisochrysis_lutea.AAC.2
MTYCFWISILQHVPDQFPIAHPPPTCTLSSNPSYQKPGSSAPIVTLQIFSWAKSQGSPAPPPCYLFGTQNTSGCTCVADMHATNNKHLEAAVHARRQKSCLFVF